MSKKWTKKEITTLKAAARGGALCILNGMQGDGDAGGADRAVELPAALAGDLELRAATIATLFSLARS